MTPPSPEVAREALRRRTETALLLAGGLAVVVMDVAMRRQG